MAEIVRKVIQILLDSQVSEETADRNFCQGKPSIDKLLLHHIVLYLARIS